MNMTPECLSQPVKHSPKYTYTAYERDVQNSEEYANKMFHGLFNDTPDNSDGDDDTVDGLPEDKKSLEILTDRIRILKKKIDNEIAPSEPKEAQALQILLKAMIPRETNKQIMKFISHFAKRMGEEQPEVAENFCKMPVSVQRVARLTISDPEIERPNKRRNDELDDGATPAKKDRHESPEIFISRSRHIFSNIYIELAKILAELEGHYLSQRRTIVLDAINNLRSVLREVDLEQALARVPPAYDPRLHLNWLRDKKEE
ncbi:unnamed protein product [Caenorhabditis bovis]|uniref:Uncharacterized protein n=1 Tax=Caenorhabditis bovis TaxID=2654633 RepID=A0A8S1FEJ5_9PELO|nr:unnamed protein product [Caenorhabditis bovis]